MYHNLKATFTLIRPVSYGNILYNYFRLDRQYNSKITSIIYYRRIFE